ncbi:Hypothetical protein HVR_LOCUS383 [uncultured virus]|nr:Hypothetical protein HVR_LOCUS383 [uncultured virus]
MRPNDTSNHEIPAKQTSNENQATTQNEPVHRDNILDMIDSAMKFSYEEARKPPPLTSNKVIDIICQIESFIDSNQEKLRDIIRNHGRLGFDFFIGEKIFFPKDAHHIWSDLFTGERIFFPKDAHHIGFEIRDDLNQLEQQQFLTWIKSKFGNFTDYSSHERPDRFYRTMCCNLDICVGCVVPNNGPMIATVTKREGYFEPIVPEFKAAVDGYLSPSAPEVLDKVINDIFDVNGSFKWVLDYLKQRKNVVFSIYCNSSSGFLDIFSGDLLKQYKTCAYNFNDRKNIKLQDICEIYNRIHKKFSGGKHFMAASFYCSGRIFSFSTLACLSSFESQRFPHFNISIVFRPNEEIPLPLKINQ